MGDTMCLPVEFLYDHCLGCQLSLLGVIYCLLVECLAAVLSCRKVNNLEQSAPVNHADSGLIDFFFWILISSY